MKKYNKKTKIIFIIFLLIVAIMVIQYVMQKKRETYQEKVGNYYQSQNKAIPRINEPLIFREFSPYEKVNEIELYVRLFVYNKNNEEREDVEVEDIKEYLSKEFNEDGTLRLFNGYEKIEHYKWWLFRGGGGGAVEDYWRDIERVNRDYGNSYVAGSTASLETIKEVIKVIEGEIDLSEINHEIMEAEEIRQMAMRKDRDRAIENGE